MKTLPGYFPLAIILTCVFISCGKDDDTQPVAGFTYTSSKSLPATVQFANLSTQVSGDTYLWGFGDGSTGTQMHPAHVYIQAGSYNVSLIHIAASGARDTVIKTLQITTLGPSGTSHRPGNTLATDFSMTITYSVPYFVSFTNTSTDATSFYWNFGDLTTSSSASTTVTHTYNTAGPHYVVLHATNDNGTDTSGVSIGF